MRFVDLFAGLGGFHLALAELGHECVFACEKDKSVRAVYKANFGIDPHPDIRSVDVAEIPAHDILCAGFPCQPFSKAGEQEGFDCPDNGDLFKHVMRIVRHHKPVYLLLENVANLMQHNGGQTWESMLNRLERAEYTVQADRLSPHHFGIPQIRERVFIVARRGSLSNFAWPQRAPALTTSIETVLERSPHDAKRVSAKVVRCLDTWQRFLDAMPKGIDLPAGPLWAMEFGATYPFQRDTPWAKRRSLSRYRGAFGVPLKGLQWQDAMGLLPSHARTRQPEFPDWKIRFIEANRAYYRINRKWIDPWLPEIKRFIPSFQKLEWNCRGEKYNIWDFVIQCRASGIRVKRRTTAPSLIAMTTTQVPIIGWERRYMTPRECARLQSMDGLTVLPSAETAAFAALGNAVNVKVVHQIALALLGKVNKQLGQQAA